MSYEKVIDYCQGIPTPTARRTAMGNAFSVCVFTEDPKLQRAKMTVLQQAPFSLELRLVFPRLRQWRQL